MTPSNNRSEGTDSRHFSRTRGPKYKKRFLLKVHMKPITTHSQKSFNTIRLLELLQLNAHSELILLSTYNFYTIARLPQGVSQYFATACLFRLLSLWKIVMKQVIKYFMNVNTRALKSTRGIFAYVHA